MDIIDNKAIQLTASGALQIKSFPAIESYLKYPVEFRLLTIETSKGLYFESVLN